MAAKKVVLLGDSIRLGYEGVVRDRLAGIADVVTPADNGRCTQYTFIYLSQWLSLAGDPSSIDVVHWNNGHWDIARYAGDGSPLNSPRQYGEMLERIAARLRALSPRRGPVRADVTGEHPRTTEEIEVYNTVAIRVMDRCGVPVVDLFSPVVGRGELFTDYCHFPEEGYRILGARVARAVMEALGLPGAAQAEGRKRGTW